MQPATQTTGQSGDAVPGLAHLHREYGHMNEDEWIALAIYAGTALIALGLYVRSSVRELRWGRRRLELH